MKISIGADHRGYKLKERLIQKLAQYDWLDRGATSDLRTDYPLYAKPVCTDVQSGLTKFGILICGSGVGMSIAANRFPQIYAALCGSDEHVVTARQHDNANILVLAADFIEEDEAVAWIKLFVDTKFLGGKYQERLEMID